MSACEITGVGHIDCLLDWKNKTKGSDQRSDLNKVLKLLGLNELESDEVVQVKGRRYVTWKNVYSFQVLVCCLLCVSIVRTVSAALHSVMTQYIIGKKINCISSMAIK